MYAFHVKKARSVLYSSKAFPSIAGHVQAMEDFLQKDRIGQFAKNRNDPNEPKAVSGLSPYIHFGQLGMQRAALQAIQVKSKFRVCSPLTIIPPK